MFCEPNQGSVNASIPFLQTPVGHGPCLGLKRAQCFQVHCSLSHDLASALYTIRLHDIQHDVMRYIGDTLQCCSQLICLPGA